MNPAAILRAADLAKAFGGVQAVDGMSLALHAGEIVGLIGPNGAGKTTLVNLLTGVLRPNAGSVHFDGVDVTRQKPHQAARRGLARTFQIVQPFPEMTVLENVTAASLFAQRIASIAEAREDARAHLAFVGLEAMRDAPARALALPDRKRLELAKSLAMRPRVLLLDEVNAGLNTAEIDKALALINSIAEQGVAIMIIEHLMKVVFELSDRVVVMHHGRLIAEGAPQQIARDEAVIGAYLGSRFAERYDAQQSR